MFAFLSRLRLMGSESAQGDSADDTSSLNRSLNLPWPVTESAARRPRAGSVGSTQPSGQAPLPQPRDISYPIPRTASNTLTGIDEQSNSHVTPHAPGNAAGVAATARPSRATPPQAASSRTAWYEPEKPRRLGASQDVVRLDSNAFVPESSDDENLDDTAPPTYSSTYANTSLEVLPHPSDQYSAHTAIPVSVLNSLAQLPPRPSRPTIPFDEDDGEGEFYTSPFDSDVEDAVPVAPRSASTSALTPVPKPPTMPKSRWGLKLQLHAAQSMPSLPGSSGPPVRHSHASEQRQTHPTYGVPALELAPNTMVGSTVETDVYNHAYSYPFVKQLSPIAELDYLSPVAESPTQDALLRFARTGNVSTSSHKDSPGSESLSGAGAALLRKDSAKESAGEKESLKTRNGSGRTGSGGSVNTVNGMASLSRAGSVTKSQTNGSPSEIMRPSPVYSSPFLTRHLNRTVSQSSSKSDTQSQTTYVPSTSTQGQGQTGVQQTRSMIAHLLTSAGRSSTSVNHSSNVNSTKEVILTPTSVETTGTTTGTMYTPTSTLHGSGGQTPTSPSKQNTGSPGSSVQSPPPVMTNSDSSDSAPTIKIGTPKIPSLPSIAPLDLRFSQIGISDAPRRDRSSKAASAFRRGVADVERMSVIHSDEGHHDMEDDDNYEDDEYDEDEYGIEVEEIEEDEEEYERESLHAESFVTAGTNDSVRDPEQGMELATFTNGDAGGEKRRPDTTGRRPDPATSGERISIHSRSGDSFILRRWDAAGSPPSEQITASPTTMQQGHAARWPFRATSPSLLASLSRTPAFWSFWLGFIFPVLWLVGGWHFTRVGECPPRVSAWEWYLWRSGWDVATFFSRITQCCLGSRARPVNKLRKTSSLPAAPADPVSSTPQQRRRGKRRSSGAAERKARAGQVYPALPRWVAEKQSTDDGRMRLNDPKRSLRGIVFGYPFVARPGASQDSAGGGRPMRKPGKIVTALTAPNRLFDLLYGVKLVEVRGRPESGRRMFDPWIQRCRYALCYAMLLLAVALCIACVWLITINTRKVISG